ncbi:hypothetical protein M378DRAFT_11018 [Amanita muscaria Koide BX008]|uniref:Uncharacterized protein n=1 Tax=Amanita muscaria (strain Koide BX008) TaxID=946122 RepID=A0A0C2X784_AMAMK|nr:hypothetical protein M378DRAFT_11018 [Amanita muscaria Koide BX008]
MVASRQRHVKQVVEASRSWQDQQISGIKWIYLSNPDDTKDGSYYALVEGLKEKRDELAELGVIVYHSTLPLISHPLSLLQFHAIFGSNPR